MMVLGKSQLSQVHKYTVSLSVSSQPEAINFSMGIDATNETLE